MPSVCALHGLDNSNFKMKALKGEKRLKKNIQNMQNCGKL